MQLKKFNNLFNILLFQMTQESTKTYTVKAGDTLSKISILTKVPLQILCKLNNIQDKNKIKIGQVLKLPENINNLNFFNDQNLSESDYNKILFIARVLYSETGTKTTEDEILKVASVIYNRAHNKKAFPYASDIYTATNNKDQFSCINDKSNTNWSQFEPNLNQRTKNAMNIAYKLYTNTFEPVDKDKNFNQKYYMYIDHSLKTVPSKFYAKQYWKLVSLPQTEHFKFYSLSPKKVNKLTKKSVNNIK